MTVEAAHQIRAELEDESRTRTRRALMLLVVFAAMIVGLAFGTGIKPDLSAHEMLVFTVAIGFVLFGIVVSFSPDLRFGRVAAAALTLVAVITPTYAATHLAEASGAPWGMLGCFPRVLALGVVALVATKVILGRTRRRFGGASLLQATGASLAAAVVVGLHCPASSLAHLATHAFGAGLVALVVGRFVLR